MIPAAFEYTRAASIDEALDLLTKYGADARILAGGQSLIPAMRYRLARPAVLVDINPVAGLDSAGERDGSLSLGALVRDAHLEHGFDLGRYALISDVSKLVADPVVRQQGTVVGSLCHNDPAGDWGVAALAARASLVVRGRGGERVVPIDDFLVDSFTTAVGEGEMALEVRFPTPPARASGAYEKIERKVGDFATAAAGVQIELGADGTIARAGVAIGAAGPTALRVSAAEKVLQGARPSAAAVAAAAEEARKLSDPIADRRGSADYKKHMAGVLVARALRRTFARLGMEIAG